MKIFCLSIIYFLIAVLVNRNFHLLYRGGARSFVTQSVGPQMSWDSATRQRISPAGLPGFYPRMIPLQDGGLLLAYASKGNIVTQKSTDGVYWQAPAIAAQKIKGVNMDTPELLQLKNGKLLLMYNGRPQGALKGIPDTTKKFDIRIQYSDDRGNTWQHEKILYRAGASFKDGCWEPSALQLPSGEIQLFFSDEAIYTTSNEQNISVLRSFDEGDSWSVTPQIISFRKSSRDGMPVPLWLPDQNKIAVAIEDPGNKNFKPCIIYSSAMGKWEQVVDGANAKRVFALQEKLPDSIYAGAPYLCSLSTGVTVLSYQSTQNRHGKNTDANAVMLVAIGNRRARDFVNATVPFDVPEGFHALWNSLCVIKNDTVIALTSTNGFSKDISEIWAVKGVVR